MIIRRAAAALLVLVSMVAVAAPQNATPWRFTDVERIVVFADVHGGYAEVVNLLRAANVVDTNLDWAAGTTHVVSLGDLIDRGPKSRQVLDLVMRVQQQAERAGGAVHVVLGNHELMNLSGDLRYVVPEDYVAFAADETASQRAAAFDRYRIGAGNGQPVDSARAAFDAKYPPGYFARREAFAPTGVYGGWLAALPIVVAVDDYAFLHGGLAPEVGKGNIGTLNNDFRRDLEKLLALKAQLESAGYDAGDAAELARRQDQLDAPESQPQGGEAAVGRIAQAFEAQLAEPLFADSGPLWYRGTALCHAVIEQGLVERGLAALQVKSVVIGHTPTSDRRVQGRFDGKVVMLDTGMLASYFHGHPAAWVLSAGHANVIYGDGGTSDAIEDIDANVGDGLTREALERFLTDAPIAESRAVARNGRNEVVLQLRDERRSLPARFVGAGKAATAELAAYRLDALLGLDLVPVAVARTVNGVSGIVTAAPDRVITEAERRQQQTVRPNWCGQGNDYELMYAFDALVGNSERSAADISYDHSSWRMQLTGNSNAFPTTRSLAKAPPGTDRTVPGVLVERLAQLNVERLQQVVGELLNKQQIAALLARRDAILKWNTTPG